MKELALHLLDIAENSVAAKSDTIRMQIVEDLSHDILTMQVHDNGCGMDADLLARVTDPFVTSRTTRKVGLGIPLLKAAAEACNGGLQIQSEPGKGTLLEVSFQHSHLDRMPLGDLTGTWLNLIIAYPQVRWILVYQMNEQVFEFDTEILRQELEGIPYSEPAVITFLRDCLSTGIAEVQSSPASAYR